MPMSDAVLKSAVTAAIPRAVATEWARFWNSTGGQVLWTVIQVAIIVVVALLVRVIAQQIIRIFVNRVVTGVKRRQRAEDTQALLASPVSAARVVQRTRTLGSVLNNVVSAVVVIVAVISI